jgi:hypothetical protein
MRTVPQRVRARRGWVTAGLALPGLLLVGLGLWLGGRDLWAEIEGPDGTTTTFACGSVFSGLTSGGVRDLMGGVFFSGRQGCELVLGRAHVATLGCLSLGTLLLAVAAVRHRNREARAAA